MNRYLRTVAIDSLSLPGDWRKRLDAPHVRALADSGDILNPPAMRKETREVIHGGDRLAAMWLRGDKEAEVWVYSDLADDQVEEMRAKENAFRRDPDLQARARLVAKRAAELAGSLDAVPETPRAPGRPKEPQTIAREEIAAATGVTPAAIRKAEQRAAEREKHDDGPPAPAQDSPATPGLAESVALDELDRLLMAAVKAVTRLAKDYPALVERFPVQDLKWKLQREVAPGFRAMRPQDRCPFCKGWPSELPNCAACKGSGWIVADQLNDIPKELLATGKDEGIYVGGTFRTLKELGEAGTKKATKGKTNVWGGKDPAPAECGKTDTFGRHRLTCHQPSGHSGKCALTADDIGGKERGARGQMVPSYTAPVPTDRATRTVLEDDFSDAWTGDEK